MKRQATIRATCASRRAATFCGEDVPDRAVSVAASAPSWGTAGIALALLVGIALAGCVSPPETVVQDVRDQRRADYAQWLAARNRTAAQEPSISGRLTLEDAVKLALLYNKELQAVTQTTCVAEGRRLEAKSRALPTADVRAAYTRLDEAPYIVFGGETLDMGVPENYSASLEVKQPLYAGGAIRSALRAAQVNAALSDAQVREQVQKTLYSVISAYYEDLLAQQLCTVKRDAVTSAEAHADDVAKRRKQGTASDYDALRAAVEVSNLKAEMIRERNRIAEARTSLLKTMGVAQEQDLELADALRYAPVPTNAEASVCAALENRPELYEAELAVRLQREAVRAAQSEYLPRLSATFSESEANPAPHEPTVAGWGNGWVVGVAAELPLFDLGRKGRVAEEKARLRQREAMLADARERVLMEVRQALLHVQNAQEFVDSQKMNLDRAAESLRLVEVGYRQGLQSQVEVTDAETAMTQTRGLYFQALYDHCMGRLALQRATGLLGVEAGRPPATGEAASSVSRDLTTAP